MTTYTALDLALDKAKNEKLIVFYNECTNYYTYEKSYDDFTFYKFKSLEDFLEKFYIFCKSKSDCATINFELQEQIENDYICATLNSWKYIYVKNFDADVNLSLYENEIENKFKKI